MFDEKEGVIPGNALVVDPKKQFRPLSKKKHIYFKVFNLNS